MAAAVLSSAPAAWTTLQTSLVNYAEDKIGNRLEAPKLAPGDLASTVPAASPFAANLPDEIRQIILLAQLGFGAQLGAGKRIGHWTAALLLRDMLTAYINAGVPRAIGQAAA
jgi:hypothetical protein